MAGSEPANSPTLQPEEGSEVSQPTVPPPARAREPTAWLTAVWRGMLHPLRQIPTEVTATQSTQSVG
eukprot:11131335-Alexandrium_andersonii.AAC.1